MNRRQRATLEAIFAHPVRSDIRWADIEKLFMALGADIDQRKGSRVAVVFPGHPPAVFHRPHPGPTDKGAVARVRDWLEVLRVTPEEEL